MSSADKIQAWRDTNPGKRIAGAVLLEILGVDSLQNANLLGANLLGANLSGSDLSDANLTRANLTGADLTGSDLWDANLWDANLTRANLRDANLTRATLWRVNLQNANLTRADLTGADLTYSTGGVAQIDNVYPYPATIQPTPDGWHARVGCWYGTLDALREIATSDDDEDWPEAYGSERERRRPLLKAILGVFDAHVANHSGVIDRLHHKWGDRA